MNQSNIKLQIPFESLVEAISSLDMEQKQKIWQILDEEMQMREDYLEESNPRIQSEITEAKQAYEAGDYITLEEYRA